MTEPDVQSDPDLSQVPHMDDHARQLHFAAWSGDPRCIDALIEQAGQMASREESDALLATSFVIDLADRGALAAQRASARRARVRALSYSGRFEEALAVGLEAKQIADDAGECVESGRTRLALMHPLCELGRLEEARSLGERAHELFTGAGQDSMAALADINLGITLHRHGESEQAIVNLLRARKAMARDDPRRGNVENSLGEAFVALNRFAEAEEAFHAAHKAFDQSGQSLNAAIAEGNAADLEYRRGRLHNALRLFEFARRRIQSDSLTVHRARLLAEQAEVKVMLGIRAQAMDEFQTALPDLQRFGLALEAARARAGIGRLHLADENLAAAETSLAAAAVAFADLGNVAMEASVNRDRALIALREGKYELAERLATAALSRISDRPADSAAVRQVLALIHFDSGKLKLALAESCVAVALAEQVNVRPLLADVLLCRGVIREASGDLDGAIEDFRRSREHVERVRGALQADRFRSAFAGERSAVYEHLVTAILNRRNDGHEADVFEVIEAAKCRSLLDSLLDQHESSSAEDLAMDAGHCQQLDEISDLRAMLNSLYSQMDSVFAADASSDAANSWRSQVHACEQELLAAESRLAATLSRGRIAANPTTLDALRRQLKPDEAFVEYFVNSGTLMALVMTADSVSVHEQLCDESRLLDAVGRFQFQVNRALRPGTLASPRLAKLRTSADAELETIHELVMAPLRERLEAFSKIIIAPHASLHQIPFAALRSPDGYLIENFLVTVIPSGSVYTSIQIGDGSRDAFTPAVIAAHDASAPAIAEEARVVASILCSRPQDTLIGPDATVNGATQLLSCADVIHIGSHGRFDPAAPLQSGLKLADGWLTVRDLASARIRASLITLSGCETGQAETSRGDEHLGLAHAFLAAGARTVLASLWRVDDEATAAFMRLFYSNETVDFDGNVANNLRAAQLELLTSHPHPAFWSPFVLVGRNS